jgi:hypothetical protein
VDQAGIEAMLGNPSGYEVLPASEQILDEVGRSRLVADVRTDESPCVTSVWAVSEPRGRQDFDGAFLRVACQSS